MAVYKEFRVGGNPNNPMGFLGPLLILAVFFTLLFFFFKGLFWVLNIVAPIIFVITLILDYTVVKDFFTFLLRLLRENPLLGVLACVLTFFGYHVVSGFLFVKALLRKSVKQKFDALKKREETYAEYVEVQEKEDDFPELPPLHKQPEKKQENPYDDMFK
jgi:hypothetical protein